MFSLKRWKQYTATSDFKKVLNFIAKECTLFGNYFDILQTNVNQKLNQVPCKKDWIVKIVETQKEAQIDSLFGEILNDYFRGILDSPRALLNDKQIWIHINELLDCLDCERVFFFDESGGKKFDFNLFYQEVRSSSLAQISQIVKRKLAKYNFCFF